MSRTLPPAVSLPAAWTAAALWAFGLVSLQPLNESGSPEAWWARDLRWGAVLAAAAALVLTHRGRRPAVRLIGAGAVAWLAADVWLDRLDTSRGSLLALTALSCAAITAAAAPALRSPHAGTLRPAEALRSTKTPRPASNEPASNEPASDEPASDETSNDKPARDHRGRPTQVATSRGALVRTAAICAVTAPLVLPDDLPSAAHLPGRLTHALLLAIALACALTAAEGHARDGRRAWLTAGVVAGIGIVQPFFTLGALRLVSAAALLAGIWLIVTPSRGGGRAFAGVAGNLVAYPVVGYVLFIALWQWGSPLTALAGNPPIPGDEADPLLPLTGAVVGSVFALFWLLPWRRVLAWIDN